MRKPEENDGFALCFVLNLLGSMGWGIAMAVLLVLHHVAGLPGILWRLALGGWVLVAAVKTFLIEWGSKASSERDPVKPNQNPYSPCAPEPLPARAEAGPAEPEAVAAEPEPVPAQAEAPVELDAREIQDAIAKLEEMTEEEVFLPN